MIPPPPRSTLFPYTTLFRSLDVTSLQSAKLLLQLVNTAFHIWMNDMRVLIIDDEPELAEDRKSTRLNSSHMSISYAVFCLKKKRSKVLTQVTSVSIISISSC